jgi:hypothetical protein
MSGANETKAEREKRLADALRANLRRRKDKSRDEKAKNDNEDKD